VTAPEVIGPGGLTEPPPGEYAVVELFGHTTLVGRITEVERFGAKMLAIECLFNGELLPVVYHGGAAIYRLTPVPTATAWAKQPTKAWHIPESIRLLAAQPALESPAAETAEKPAICSRCHEAVQAGGCFRDDCPIDPDDTDA
jgi:hypothetical protein